ncbi:putative structural protein [Acinetobacter phage DMU1]|nr:putative structural protein [Acinetobacter phage DMU1]
MSDGSRHSMHQVLETVYGEVPATPAFKRIRHNSTTLATAINTLTSEELRPDRNSMGIRHGTRQVGGEIVSELSFESLDDTLEALMCGTWTADALVNGVTRRSFSILRQFNDLTSASLPNFVYVGCEYNTMTLSITTEAIVMATFGIVGMNQLEPSSTAPTGATFIEAPTTEPMDSFTGHVKEGLADIAVATELELQIENGIAPRYVIGSKKSIKQSIGRFKVSGTLTAYFEDATLVGKFLREETSSLEFVVTDGLAGNSYKFELPRIKYTGGQPDVGGEGPITLSMPFVAEYDPTILGTLKITRIGA